MALIFIWDWRQNVDSTIIVYFLFISILLSDGKEYSFILLKKSNNSFPSTKGKRESICIWVSPFRTKSIISIIFTAVSGFNWGSLGSCINA